MKISFKLKQIQFYCVEYLLKITLKPSHTAFIPAPTLSNSSPHTVKLQPPYFQLDFQLAAEGGDLATFIPNGEWALLGEQEIHLIIQFIDECRGSGYKKRGYLRLLPRAIPGHHLCYKNKKKNSLLFLQPDSALLAHCFHGCSGLHSSSGFRGETITGYEY